MKSFFQAALTALFFTVFCGVSQAQQAKLPTEPVVILTQKGHFTFSAEIADTNKTREIGLMFREKMGRREAMMFKWQESQEINMWMRNTPLSLDMIFVNRRGVVVHIARDTKPFSLDIVSSQKPVNAVIEVVAGTADDIGLATGDNIRHMFFE